MQFQFFDPEADIAVSARRLPHWEQARATYFITFRTADSLPESVLRAWRQERDRWLRQHHIDPLADNWQDQLRGLPAAAQHEFSNRFTRHWQELLDSGHGECVLRRPELSQIVARSLLHADGDRYDLGDFVVMPNHVHLLVMFAGLRVMKLQCRSWKKFTAGEINLRLGRRGAFWQGESFDHLVRSEVQFEYLRSYIRENPAKAGLRVGEFHYYRRKD
ncbi:MAG: hypothetical protein SFU86_04125 [Pirellulaceae bacterium]|nr:hypothetical protein [Pirellulaceae bacterium]